MKLRIYSPCYPRWFNKLLKCFPSSVSSGFLKVFKTKQPYVRIDEYDSWSADYTISVVAVPLLKQLKITKQGSPYVDDEDVPEHLRSTAAPPKEKDYDIDAFHHQRWEWILDEMIWAMEQIRDDNWLKLDRERDERIDNGCRLFGKYFRALWD